jgi:hypothetical protein
MQSQDPAEVIRSGLISRIVKQAGGGRVIPLITNPCHIVDTQFVALAEYKQELAVYVWHHCHQ